MESQNVSFRVAREDLVTAVAWVARNLPTKPTQPVLRAMLITADDEGLELAGYDYDVSTRVRLSAEVSQPGRIAVAGKLLSEITGSLPNKPVDFRIDGSKAFVTCGSSRFELPLIPLDDYPMLPKLPAGTGSINAKLFTEAVSQVASAAGKDDSLPMLTGVSMEIVGNQINLAATDRFRLALRTFEWEANDPELNVKLLIPARTLLDNARSLIPVSTIPSTSLSVPAIRLAAKDYSAFTPITAKPPPGFSTPISPTSHHCFPKSTPRSHQLKSHRWSTPSAAYPWWQNATLRSSCTSAKARSS